MSLLASVTTGKTVGAQIHTIAGNNGVGKTTWATNFPKAIIADIENGSRHIENVSRVAGDKLTKLADFRSLVSELIQSKHDYLTFIIDSVESLEGLICDFVCSEGNVDSIEKYEGGYGKGWHRTREIMREIMGEIQKLQAKGVTTILVAHTQVKQHSDPATNQVYDRVIMRCNDKMAALIRDLSDNVFYASYKVFTTKENGKTRAYGDGQRVMFCQWRPGFDAKNRLDLPLELPLSYDAFVEACGQKSEANSEEILADIKDMSEKIDDKMKADIKALVEKHKANPQKLKEIKNRLMKYVAA